MNMPFLYFLNTLVIATEAVFMAYIATGFFEPKVSRKVFVWSVVGLWAAEMVYFIVGGVSSFSDMAFLNNIAATVLFTIWAYLVFRPGILPSFFTALLAVVLLCLSDYVSIAIATAASGNSTIFFEDPNAFYMLAFASRILAIFGAAVIRVVFSRRFRGKFVSLTSWLQVLFYPLVSIVIIVLLAQVLFRTPENSLLLLFCVLALLVSDILSVFLLERIERQRQAIQDNLVLQQNLRLAADQVQALESAHDQQRQLTHDFKNQLAVLRNMAGTDTPREEMTRYLDSILESAAPAGSYVETHRLIANLLINQKMEEAKRGGIAFDVQLDDLSRFPLSDEALVVVLSNLLDNAIEACEKIPPEGDRRIRLKMQTAEAASFLSVENTTAAPVKIVRNAVQTSKSDSLEHGYGLKNVCSTLDHAGAIYTMNYNPETSVFSFLAQLGVPDDGES